MKMMNSNNVKKALLTTAVVSTLLFSSCNDKTVFEKNLEKNSKRAVGLVEVSAKVKSISSMLKKENVIRKDLIVISLNPNRGDPLGLFGNELKAQFNSIFGMFDRFDKENENILGNFSIMRETKPISTSNFGEVSIDDIISIKKISIGSIVRVVTNDKNTPVVMGELVTFSSTLNQVFNPYGKTSIFVKVDTDIVKIETTNIKQIDAF